MLGLAFAINLVVLPHVFATNSTWLPSKFSAWFWQTSVIVGHWLYIEGGEVWHFVDGRRTFSQLNQTIALPLSTSWTNSSVNPIINSKPADYSNARLPALWYDPVDNSVFSWGGWPYDNNDGGNIWAFKPDGQGGAVWEERYSTTDTLWTNFSSPFGALWAFGPNSFYTLGGCISQHASPFTAISGLSVFDFQKNIRSNTSSTGYSDSGYGVFGAAQFVPAFGEDGLIVAIGGDLPSNQSYSYDNGASLRDMSDITVYDIHTEQWYHQLATGDIPPAREHFCMAGVQENGVSSYELFVYGGSLGAHPNQHYNPDLANVFVLTLPAFKWIRVSNSSTQSRAWHSCQVIGGRQMLSIGGLNPQEGRLGQIADTWTNGLGVFDMSVLEWTSGYNASAEAYVQSELIKQYYIHNPRYPSDWDNQALKSIFSTAIADTTASPTGSQTGIGTVNPSPNHLNIGVIAGGAVGTSLGLILLLILTKIVLAGRGIRDLPCTPVNT